MSDGNALILDYSGNGKGAGTLTARCGERVLHVDQLDVRKAKSRTVFIDTLCDKLPGVNRTEVDAELLRLAGDTVKAGTTQETEAAELDADGVLVRPELFHTASVSGVCVPVMRLLGGKPRGSWVQYLRWHTDGRREQRELEPSIELADGGRLWVWPTPGEPLPTQRAGWSASARRDWLDGAAAPDGPDVFKRTAKLVAYYLDFPKDVAVGITTSLACWVLLTYSFPAWLSVPYLSIGGPLGSGKSTLFRVLGRLCYRPLESSNMTAACLFRTLHETGGTLLLDEAERLRESAPDSGELRSILLSGYKQGSPAFRLEKSGDGFKRTSFDVYGPKAFAAINHLPEALASRCIRVAMLRAEPSSPKPRRRFDDKAAEFAALRDDLHALALEHGPTWLALARQADVVPHTFGGRDYELWQPLLALAAWLDESGASGVLGVLLEFAEATVAAGRDDTVNDADETLLTILAEHVRVGTAGMLKAGEILAAACERDPATFGSRERPRWSAKGVGNRLRNLGIETTKGRGSIGRTYSKVSEADLRRLERVYGFELGFYSLDVPTCTPSTDNAH